MENKTSVSPKNFESQEGKGVFWKFVKSVKDHINNALDRKKIRDEWKQNIVKEFRMLSPQEKNKIKERLLSYFKEESLDYKRSYLPDFYLPNWKIVDPLNEHIFDPKDVNVRKDFIINQIRPFFQSVDWSDKDINRTIFDFLEEFGIQVRPSISPLGSRIW